MEKLEERCLLTSYVVDTAVDVIAADGLLSLREAIVAAETNLPFSDANAGAAAGDVIVFDVLLDGATINLLGPGFTLSDDLVIGDALAEVTIDAGALGRHFDISGNEVITFTRVNLVNGLTTGDGGAVAISGTPFVRFTDLVIADNAAAGDGGGVFNNGGTVEFVDAAIQNNDATGVGARGGGAFSLNGRVTLFNSLVAGNSASSQGGGLWSQSRLVVRDGSQITSNAAHGAAASEGGGGLFNNGGLLRVMDSLVSGNEADGLAGSGGGIFSTGGTLDVRGSTISANVANRAGGGIEVINGYARLDQSVLGGTQAINGNVAGPAGLANPGNGGGLHVSGTNGTTIDLTGTLVQNNFAAQEGGGLWHQTGGLMQIRFGTTIRDNEAAGPLAHDGGGGVFNNGGYINVISSQIFDNTATGLAGSGGGILTLSNTVAILGSDVSGNTAVRAGGGVEIVDGVLLITDSSFISNVAGPGGAGAPGNGGAVHVTGSAGTNVVSSNSEFSQNIADAEGGGLWNQAGSRMVLKNNTRVTGNSALGDAADDGGGGVFNNGGLLRILDSIVSDNEATGIAGSGGGILSTDGILNIRRSDIFRNFANRAGGGIEVIDGIAILLLTDLGGPDGSFANVAGASGSANPGSGGGLHISGGSGTFVGIEQSLVRNNFAFAEGGGLWVQAGSLLHIIGGSTIQDNLAENGGGLFINGGRVSVINSAFLNNDANESGGAIFVASGGELFYDTPSISNNTSGSVGGGIFNDGLISLYDGGTISFNVASGTGGGLFTTVAGTSFLGTVVFVGNLPNNTN